jgi:hypothetical protein
MADSDSDSEERVNIDPPCVYHPTLGDFLKYKEESEKQFQKMRDSLTFSVKDPGKVGNQLNWEWMNTVPI